MRLRPNDLDEQSVFTFVLGNPRFAVRVAGSLVRVRAQEFLEPRIISKPIEHWIEPKKRGRERHAKSERPSMRYRQEFLQSGDSAIRVPRARRHPGKDLDRNGTK